MKSQTKAILSDLEDYIKEKSYKLPIFKGYTAINKKGVEHFIDMIYATLPEDVMQARKYLRSLDVDFSVAKGNNDGLYDNIKSLEVEMDSSPTVVEYAIVNINRLENIIDKIHSSLPKELTTIEKINK